MKKIAIVQSNYIPWKGYFDMIAAVDEFILYDDAQYTRRDWRNRNIIKTPHGLKWLTVPVRVKGRFSQRIRDVEIDGSTWQETHWKTLCHHYARAPHFHTFAADLEAFYLHRTHTHLWQLNRALIEWVCAQLGIGTKITCSWEYDLSEGKNERLADLCAQAGGTEYVSGPAARGYIDERIFAARGINLSWFDYESYPEYPQLWGDFQHGVTILDLLFNCAHHAPRYMKHVNV